MSPLPISAVEVYIPIWVAMILASMILVWKSNCSLASIEVRKSVGRHTVLPVHMKVNPPYSAYHSLLCPAGSAQWHSLLPASRSRRYFFELSLPHHIILCSPRDILHSMQQMFCIALYAEQVSKGGFNYHDHLCKFRGFSCRSIKGSKSWNRWAILSFEK